MSDLQVPLNPIPVSVTPGAFELAAKQGLTGKTSGSDQLQEAAKSFESVFLHKLMEEMSRTIPDSGFLTSGISKQVQGIFWLYLSQDVAAKGGIWLWKNIQQSMETSMQTDPDASTLELTR